MFFIFYISIVEIFTGMTPILFDDQTTGYADFNNQPLEPFYAVRITRIVTDSGEVTDFTTSLFDEIVSLKFLSDFANIWVSDNFAELLTFFSFFGFIVIVIHAIIAELTWITQFFNSKNAPVFKKILRRAVTYHLACVFENTLNGTYFKGMFFSYFY